MSGSGKGSEYVEALRSRWAREPAERKHGQQGTMGPERKRGEIWKVVLWTIQMSDSDCQPCLLAKNRERRAEDKKTMGERGRKGINENRLKNLGRVSGVRKVYGGIGRLKISPLHSSAFRVCEGDVLWKYSYAHSVWGGSILISIA